MKKYLLTICLPVLILSTLKSQETGVDLESISKSESRQFDALRQYDVYSVSSNNYDVGFYRCEWIVDPAVRHITGKVTSYFTITSATNTIIFDLNNALIVDSVLYGGNKITFTRLTTHGLQINFPSQLNATRKDSVSVFYHGVPPPGGGYFVTSTHTTVPILWTLSEPYGARTWWPCKDVLMDKPDSIHIIITNPLAYISSSNGLPVTESVTALSRTTFWRHRYPIVPYLVAIAVTNYSVDNDAVILPERTMPVVMYAYPESVATFKAATNTAKFCLQNFIPLISSYPFVQERYAQTQFGVGGGMEHQTNTFIGSPNAGLVAHELAHQWFGDKVTCGSWSDLWLNEGFASYMEYVYVELSNPAGKIPFLQNWRNNITSVTGGSVYVTDTLNIGRLFDSRLTYRKGGYLLHMLRWKMGDSSFFRGIRRYINDPLIAYKTARTADLQRNLEAESGQSLTEFFNDWFYGAGYANYNAEWSQEPNNTVKVKLHQTTSDISVSFYEMPVPLQFKNATRDTIIRVNHTMNGQLFSVDPGFISDTLIIDPELKILAKTKSSLKVLFVPVINNDLLIYPNPVYGMLTISLPQGSNLSVNIFNAIGQKLYENKNPSSGGMTEVNTMKWSAGVYWVQIAGNDFYEVKKILVAIK